MARTCLIVDDDRSVRAFVRMVLHREAFETLEASSGNSAFEIVCALGGSIDLIVTDIQMLNGDGLTLARAVRKLYPSVPILLMSGHYWPDTGFDFLEKPFTSVGLTVFIRKLTAPTAARLAWADTVRAGQ